MNLYNLPGLSGYKTALGAWGLILIGAGGILGSLGAFISGSSTFAEVQEGLMTSFVTFSAGLTALGFGHKMQKAEEKK